jgi:hypothetical protein
MGRTRVKKASSLPPEKLAELRRAEEQRLRELHERRMAEVAGSPFDWDSYNQQQADAEKEGELLRELVIECCNIGYKALATRMHPDKPGGSDEAMSRLNKARRIFKDRFA